MLLKRIVTSQPPVLPVLYQIIGSWKPWEDKLGSQFSIVMTWWTNLQLWQQFIVSSVCACMYDGQYSNLDEAVLNYVYIFNINLDFSLYLGEQCLIICSLDYYTLQLYKPVPWWVVLCYLCIFNNRLQLRLS